mmetsp:Transcript_12052/g.17960  ORF Transcript_12052/g.17960 Transcript_12052/m.17960 type:complete len:104 (-) Transcript_12052:810-1121(-)
MQEALSQIRILKDQVREASELPKTISNLKLQLSERITAENNAARLYEKSEEEVKRLESSLKIAQLAREKAIMDASSGVRFRRLRLSKNQMILNCYKRNCLLQY